jgi:hypothetical protein
MVASCTVGFVCAQARAIHSDPCLRTKTEDTLACLAHAWGSDVSPPLVVVSRICMCIYALHDDYDEIHVMRSRHDEVLAVPYVIASFYRKRNRCMIMILVSKGKELDTS